jgi:EmrB/QacA subfamily drug resistance transporter
MTLLDKVTPPIGRPGSAAGKQVSPALILAVLSIASFLAQLDVWITNVGLPAIGSGVHADSLSNLSWVLNGYAIVYAALLVPAGRLADRFGRKAGFLFGLTLFGVASLGAGLSGDIWVLVGFRALQAVGAAVLTPASLGLVLTSAPPDKVVKYVKIWFTSGALSAAMGPVLGGLLVQASWRWLFLINLPVVIAAVVLAVRLVPNSRHEQDARFPDILGGLVLIVAVGSLALALVEAPTWGWSSARVIIAFAIAAIALATFLRRSSRHPVPVVELGLFKDRIFSAANLGAMLAFASFGLLLLSTILWLQGHWHYSAIKTGFASAPGPVLFATFAAVAETLQQRYKIRPGAIAAAGTAIASVGALLFTFLLHEDPSYLTGFLPCWVLIGIGFGLAIPTTVSAATVDLRPEQAATGSAIVSMSMQIGSVLGISLLVAILGTASGGASLSIFRHAWLLSVPIGALAIITAFGMNPKRRGDTIEEAAELLVLAEAEA